MTQEKMMKIGQILAADGNAAALEAANTAEEVIAFFASRGVGLTADDVNELVMSVARAETESGELDEESLESVAGGCITIGMCFALAALIIKIYGIRYAEKKYGMDFNGDGRIG